MRTRSLTLIGPNPAVLKDPRVDAAIQRWPQHDRPPIFATTIENTLNDRAALDRSGIVWIVLDRPDLPQLFDLIGCLQDRDMPAMLSQPGEDNTIGATFQEGVVAAPLEAGPDVLCVTLRTLWNQAAVVHSLKAEVDMLKAHHGGLCDQIGKIDEELRLAAKLQREFLSETKLSCHQTAFRVLYRPANYVSGDIYDMMQLDDEHVGFFIADAAGHGVPAALMTMYIKRSLHTKEMDLTRAPGDHIVPPNEAMRRLNNDMVRQQTGRTRFATACYGVLNCRTLELSLARAGHPFPLLIPPHGSTTMLEPDGMVLGVFPDNQYELVHHKLQAGDRLVLYSDGFEMAFPYPQNDQNPNQSTINNQYLEEFKDLAHGPIDQAMQRLEHKLDHQIGSLNQRDDLTVLCISVGDASIHEPADPASRLTLKTQPSPS